MDSDEHQPEDDYADRRFSPRAPINGNSKLVAEIDGRKHLCRLVNISTGGATLYFDDMPPQVATLAIEHPQLGRLSGRCMWQANNQLGMKFDDFEL